MPLQHLTPCPEAGLGSLHAHRLLGQGEDLRKVKEAHNAREGVMEDRCFITLT